MRIWLWARPRGGRLGADPHITRCLRTEFPRIFSAYLPASTRDDARPRPPLMSAIPHGTVPHNKPITLRANDMEAGYLLLRRHRPAVLKIISSVLRGEGGLVIGGAGDEGETLAVFDGFEGSGAALVPEVACAAEQEEDLFSDAVSDAVVVMVMACCAGHRMCVCVCVRVQ